MKNRENIIVKASIEGIAVNLILVGFKAVVGFFTNSIAIILDAVNNFSDALSQVITIVGTKLSMKRPDKQHPYGYGRIEYITSAIVAALILFTGISAFRESLNRIFNKEPSVYTTTSLIIIAVAVAVKFIFGRYILNLGKKIESDTLIATGTDSTMDSVLSLSTLVAALISKFFNINLEGILGVILSVFIIKAGFEIFKGPIQSLIGGRIDSELSMSIKKRIKETSGVKGVYDLILHDYGPSRSIGSVHIEVASDTSAAEIHRISHKISESIYEEYKIVLTVGVYAASSDEKTLEVKEIIANITKNYPSIMGTHGLFLDEETNHIFFDILISHTDPKPVETALSVKSEVESKYNGWECFVNIDHDFSDWFLIAYSKRRIII